MLEKGDGISYAVCVEGKKAVGWVKKPKKILDRASQPMVGYSHRSKKGKNPKKGKGTR